jgi:ketosteroid isomerase-like protein
MSRGNAEVAEKVLAAFAARDMDAVLSFMDSEVVWTTAEDEPDHQTYKGHDGVRQLYGHWSELWEAGFEAAFDTEELRTTGTDVIIPVRVQVRGRGSGVEVEIHETYVFTFAAGKIVRVREFRTKQEALEAAGLSE